MLILFDNSGCMGICRMLKTNVRESFSFKNVKTFWGIIFVKSALILLVKSAFLAASPCDEVDLAAVIALYAGVWSTDATPKESAAAVTADCAVVKMRRGTAPTHCTRGRQRLTSALKKVEL